MDDTVARFEIEFSRFIHANGGAVRALPDSVRDPTVLKALYRALVRTRTFDAKAIALQRTGRLGTYASSLGQEAVSVGSAAAMRDTDLLLPSFREHGAQLWRGVKPLELFLYWGGDERGSDFAGPRAGLPHLRAGRQPCAACGRASRSRSSCGANRGSPSAFSATGRPRKAMSPRQ